MELVTDKFIATKNSNPAADSSMPQLVDPHLAQLNLHQSMLHDNFETQMAYDERLKNEGDKAELWTGL